MERVQASLPKAVGLSADPLGDEAFSLCMRIGSDVIWANLPTLATDAKLLSRNRVVTAHRSDPAHVAFDMLRTSLLQITRQNQWS